MVAYSSSPASSPSPNSSMESIVSFMSSAHSSQSLPASDQSLNALWALLADLSSTLGSNRTATADLVGLAQAVISEADTRKVREDDAVSPTSSASSVPSSPDSTSASSPTSSTSEAPGAHPAQQEISAEELIAENKRLRHQVAALEKEKQDLDTLTQQYESTLERVMDGVRNHAFTSSNTILSLHKSYNAQLEAEKDKYRVLAEEHSEFQERLKRVAEFLRLAYAEGEDNDDMDRLMSTLRALEVENKGMRQVLDA
ncbi:uncharacterized protein V1510DRAFT_377956 [Dipodascopsis tothii]|uniref:uncharacterized protein n=1 Tax=Dipodascopsis tothii TaxID=44089 RepID=UPI0034CFD108